MSVNAQKWAWDQGPRCGLTQAQALLLVRIADHADNDGVCWPGNSKLAHYCVSNESTIRRNLRKLEDLELLHRERRMPKSGRGRATDSIVLHLDQPGRAPGKSGGASHAGTDNPTTPDQPGVAPAKSAATNRAMTHDQPGNDDRTNRALTHSLYIEEPKENPQEPKNNNGPPLLDSEWEDWLSDYRETTGFDQVRGSDAARAMFRARRGERWSLADLKTATLGCNSDPWRRERGHVVPETILRASNVEKYRLAGLAVQRKASKVPERVSL